MSLIYVDIKQAKNLRKTLTGRPQPWYWVALSGDNNRVLGRSSERYTNKQDCIDSATLLFGTGSNVYLRETEHGNVQLRLATTGPAGNVNKIK